MIRTFIMLSLLLFTAREVHSQNKYSSIDSQARELNTKSRNPKVIHKNLTRNLTSNEMKVRSFYVWIAENIEYDVDLFHNRSKLKKLNKKPLKFRLKRTLRKRSAVCGGYSELFRELCRLSGIPAEIESGFYKIEPRNIAKQGKADHAWNKVKIGNKWRLIDVTWGSGYVSKKHFFKDFREEYFFTDRKKFYHNHYPAKSSVPYKSIGFTRNEFINFPLVHFGFFRWIKSLEGDSKIGKKEILEGETVYISFIKDGPIGTVWIHNAGSPSFSPEVVRDGDLCTIAIKFDEPGYYEPTISINTMPALTYKVIVREREGVVSIVRSPRF